MQIKDLLNGEEKDIPLEQQAARIFIRYIGKLRYNVRYGTNLEQDMFPSKLSGLLGKAGSKESVLTIKELSSLATEFNKIERNLNGASLAKTNNKGEITRYIELSEQQIKEIKSIISLCRENILDINSIELVHNFTNLEQEKIGRNS